VLYPTPLGNYPGGCTVRPDAVSAYLSKQSKTICSGFSAV